MSPENQAALSSGAGYALLILAAGLIVVVVIVVFVIVYPREQRRREGHWRAQIEARRLAQVREAEKRKAAIGPGQYQCTSCGKVYDQRGDEDLLVEALAAFQALPLAHGPPVVICDDCYRQIMGDDPPRLSTGEGA